MNKNKIWLQTRREWLRLNPPNHQGQYICGICGKTVSSSYFELHHDEGRDGDNLTDMSKLRPTHQWCNQLVGSRKSKSIISLEEYEFRKDLDL